MILDGSPNKGRGSAATPLTGLILTPTRIYAYGGRTFADFGPSSAFAGSLRGVAVAGLGGGPTRFAHFARETPNPTAGDRKPQMLVMFVGKPTNRHPFACMDVEEAGLLDAAAPEHTEGGSRSKGFGVTDTAIGNGGSRVIIGEAGDVTMDTTGATDPTVRVQLPAGGKFRVSRAGGASDRLVLRSAFLTQQRANRAQFNLLAAAVAALQDIVIPSGAPWQPIAYPDPESYSFGAAALPISGDAE